MPSVSMKSLPHSANPNLDKIGLLWTIGELTMGLTPDYWRWILQPVRERLKLSTTNYLASRLFHWNDAWSNYRGSVTGSTRQLLWKSDQDHYANMRNVFFRSALVVQKRHLLKLSIIIISSLQKDFSPRLDQRLIRVHLLLSPEKIYKSHIQSNTYY